MDMSVNIAGVEWKNPVTVASGTFGSGAEFADYVDINKLGAVTTKGVANVPWAGNPTPRVAEVYGGMMNAIGLQNPGIDLFCERDIPFLKQYDTKIIVNVCGHAPEEYLAVVERLADQPIDMMEINISCPNVNAGFLAFGQDAHHVEELTAQIKKIAKQPVIMKLTPNVTDITEIAKGAEAGVDILHGLVQIQPYRGEIVVPGQGKARSTRRNAEFGFSFHSILFRSCSCTFCKQERCFCAKAGQLLSAKALLPVK